MRDWLDRDDDVEWDEVRQADERFSVETPAGHDITWGLGDEADEFGLKCYTHNKPAQVCRNEDILAQAEAILAETFDLPEVDTKPSEFDAVSGRLHRAKGAAQRARKDK